MKALIKYPLSLFVLLLIGYSQLFAPLYRGSATSAPTKKITESAQSHALAVKTTEAPTIFIAEEEEEGDERDSIKKYSEEYSISLLPCSPGYFAQLIERELSFYTLSFNPTLSRSPYLIYCVFRL